MRAAREAALGALLKRVIPDIARHQAKLIRHGNPASVLGLRHALRSLRMLLGLLQREAPSPQLADLRDKARRMTAALGPVRALDAFRMETLPRARKAGLDSAHARELATAVKTARAEALAEVRAALSDDALVDFSQQLAALPAAMAPASRVRVAVATPLLRRLQRRMLRLGKGFAGEESEARHKLRLAGKALVDLAALVEGDVAVSHDPIRRAERLTAAIGRARDRQQALAIIQGIVAPDASTVLAEALTRAGDDEERRLRRRWQAFRRAPKVRAHRR
jgi:CHAD domain-containing protein